MAPYLESEFMGARKEIGILDKVWVTFDTLILETDP